MNSGYTALPQQDQWIKAQSHALMEQTDQENKTATWIVIVLCWILVILTFPFCLILCIKVIPIYQNAIVFRLGRKTSEKPLGPGTIFVLPCIDRFERVDLRTKAFNVAPQECLTKDQAVVSIGAMVYYKIVNPVLMIMIVQNVMHAMRSLGHTTLQALLKGKFLYQVENDSLAMSEEFQMFLQEGVRSWGISIERAELTMARVVHSPGLIQRVTDMKDKLPAATSPAEKSVSAVRTGTCALNHAEILHFIKSKITANLVSRVQESFEFYLHGQTACCLHLDLVTGDGFADDGVYPFGKPSAKLYMESDDLTNLLAGTLNPMKSYKEGRLKMSGSTNAVVKLYTAFSEIDL